MYSHLIGFHRHASPAYYNGEQSPVAKGTDKLTVEQSSSSIRQFSDSTNAKHLTGEKHGKDEKPQSRLTFSHFTDLLSVPGITSKVEEYIRGKQDQSFKVETPQAESDEELLQDIKETEPEVQALQNNNGELPDQKQNDAGLSEEAMLLSTLRLQTKWENGETVIKGNEFVTDNFSALPPPQAKSQFDHAEQSEEQLLQISKYPDTHDGHSGSSERQEMFEEEIKGEDSHLKEYHRIILESEGELTEVSSEPRKISIASFDDEKNVCKKGEREADSMEDGKRECDHNGISEDGNINNIQMLEELLSDELPSKICLRHHSLKPNFLEGYKKVMTDIKSKSTVTSEKYPTGESHDSLQCSALREYSIVSSTREDGLNKITGNEDLIRFYQKDINHSQNPSKHGLKLRGNKVVNREPTTKYGDAEKQNYEEKENAPIIHEPIPMDISQTWKKLHSDILVSHHTDHTMNEDRFQGHTQKNDLISPMSSQEGHITEGLSMHENISKSDATEIQYNDKATLEEENISTGQSLQKQEIEFHSTYTVSSAEVFKLQEELEQLDEPDWIPANKNQVEDLRTIHLQDDKEIDLHELSSKTELHTSDDETEKSSNSNKGEHPKKEEMLQKEKRDQKDPLIPSDLDLVSLGHLEDVENIKEKENCIVCPQDDISIKLPDVSETTEIFQDSSGISAAPIQQAFIEQLNFVGNFEEGNLASHLDLVSSSDVDIQTIITAYKGLYPGQPTSPTDREDEPVTEELPCLISEHDLAFDTQHRDNGKVETSVKKYQVLPTENHSHLEDPDFSAKVACDERNRNTGIVGSIFSKTSEIFGDVYETNDKLEAETNSDTTEMHYENSEAQQTGSSWTDHGLLEQVITAFASEPIPAKHAESADQPEDNLQNESSEPEFLISEDSIAKKDSSRLIEQVKKEEVLGKERQDVRDILASLDSDLNYNDGIKIINRESDNIYPHPKEDMTVKLQDVSMSKQIFQDSSIISEEPGQQTFIKEKEQLSQKYPTVIGNSEASHSELISSAEIDVQTLTFHERHNPDQPVSPTDRQEVSLHEHLAFVSPESEVTFDNEYVSKEKEESYVEKHEILVTEHHNWSEESDNSEKADWELQNRIYSEKQERLPSQNRMDVKSLPPQETVGSTFARTSWGFGDFFNKNIDNDKSNSSENKNLTHELNEKLEDDGKKQPDEDIKSDGTEMHYDDTKNDKDLPAGKGLVGHVLQEHTIISLAPTYTNPIEEELQIETEPDWIPANKNQVEDRRTIHLQDISSETESLTLDDATVDKGNSNFRQHFKKEGLEIENQNLLASPNSEIQQPSSSSYLDDTENIIKRESNFLYPRHLSKDKLTGIFESKEISQDSLITSVESSHQDFIEQRKLLSQEQPRMMVNSEVGNVPSHLDLVTFHDQSLSPTHRQEESMLESVMYLTSVHASDEEQIGKVKEKTYAEKANESPTEQHNQSEESDSSEKAGDWEEGKRIDRESQETIAFPGTKDQRYIPAKGMMTIIFSRASGFLGDLFNRNRDKDTNSQSEYKITNHESNENVEGDRKDIINLEPSTGQKSDLIENTFGKVTVLQSTETIDHLAKISDLMLPTEEPETGTWEKSTIEEAEDEKESEKLSFTGTDSVLQQNKEEKMHEINLVIRRAFSELQELHQMVTRVPVAQLKSVCEGSRMKLLWYEQHLESIESEVSTSTCEKNSREEEHDNVARSATHKSEILNENCTQDKMRWLQKLQDLLSAIRAQCAAQDSGVNAEPDTAANVESLNPDPENIHCTNTELGKGHETEAHIFRALRGKKKEEHLSDSHTSEDAKELLSGTPVQHVDHSPYYEDEPTFWMLWNLKTSEIRSFVKCAFSAVATHIKKLMEAFSEDLQPGPDQHGFPWEMVFCAVIVGLFTVLLFICRTCQSIKSRLYVGRERQLATKVAELVGEKCSILEKLSLCKQQYEELELSLKEADLLKETSGATCLEATSEELNRSNIVLQNEVKDLEEELEEEKSKRLEQDNLRTEIQKRIESLENEAKTIKSHTEEARTTLKVFQISRGRLEISLQDATEERSHLQESNQQLSHEAEGWNERFSELNEQTKMFESSKRDLEDALNNKESQIKSLTECLLAMKDWSSELGSENDNKDNSLEVEMKSETENGEHLEDDQKQTVKKLIYAAKLSASLKTLEAERNQIYAKLSDEVKAKEELADRIKQLQNEQSSLHSETSRFESEVQKLQQKLRVMTEMYQENEMKLHRKLTVEEKYRLQKEEKLSKVDEKINHAAEELNSYRTRAKDLEEELEKTIRSYQSQITSHEKKAHDNWLAARAAERNLNDVRKENAHNRQKLTEAEFKLELLEKDPYALDVSSAAFGRENSPCGPSPLGRPSSETRAFVSPPTLLEGPLRLSPVLPGGGEQALRGAGNHAEYPAPNECAELSYDRISDHQKTRSGTGSLSPPWERERRMNVPISGGQPPPENSLGYESSGNGPKENFGGLLNASDRHLPSGIEGRGSGYIPLPHPPIRSPLLPVDPRGPFLRRGPLFPPPLHPGMYGPREYFPRDFAGVPRPPPPMRNPFPPWPLPNFPPQRAGFFPPLAPPESRNELLSELAHHSSSAPSAVNAETQQEP
ncbi:melanoma inhibitory activity protein 2 isoform X1 [Microcaecilia unicolor]|uniref:Melanoma inhibitory activity protein 2 isoform X1 n=3 Tax=Microcaecilia unicolor TaxID=1415580 RepID=A0A6P7Z277_9AMPH|nr:melanoma inhibitory activity protein 2 isoform X1 [Microcaecilia unicolor]